jgi:hypothetical protein
MKKQDLKKLALIGISAGIVLSKGPLSAAVSDDTLKKNNESNMNYHLMTEDELLLELTPEGEKLYHSLDAEGKKLALAVASQYCNGTNICRGLNACKTDDNECAGKGACKGKSKCAFSSKDLAVKVVADKMKAKRNALTK